MAQHKTDRLHYTTALMDELMIAKADCRLDADRLYAVQTQKKY